MVAGTARPCTPSSLSALQGSTLACSLTPDPRPLESLGRRRAEATPCAQALRSTYTDPLLFVHSPVCTTHYVYWFTHICKWSCTRESCTVCTCLPPFVIAQILARVRKCCTGRMLSNHHFTAPYTLASTDIDTRQPVKHTRTLDPLGTLQWDALSARTTLQSLPPRSH